MVDIQVYTPTQVAERLKITTAALRRLAPHYERVFDQLPRDSRQGRVWTGEAVVRLEQARQMYQAGQVVSVEAALEHIALGGEPSEAVVQRKEEAQDPLERLVTEVQRLREAVEAQNVLLSEQGKQISVLTEENQKFQAQLPAPEPEPRRGLWAWLRGRRR